MLSTRSGESASDEDGKRVYGSFPIGGNLCGWEIFVGDDRDGDTGGYYIYLKKIDCEGFDCWFEHEAGLQSQLADFEVMWED